MFKEYSLGQRLNLLRNHLGMTQKNIAEQLNVSDKTISKWETMENQPSIDEIQKLVQLYEISLELLLKGQVVTDKDKEIIHSIQTKQQLEASKKEVKDFLKNTKYKDIELESLFIFIDNQPYALFDAIIKLDDFYFYNLVNEKFTFVKIDNHSSNANNEKYCKLQHPYSLSLYDIADNNSLEFYRAIIDKKYVNYENALKNYEKNKEQGFYFYGYPKNPKEEIERELSNILNNMKITNMNDNQVYRKIIYLIDNGAVYEKVNARGEYAMPVQDRHRTDLTYKFCLDHINFIKELEELKKKICELQAK